MTPENPTAATPTEPSSSAEREALEDAGYAEAEEMLCAILSPDLINDTAIRVARDYMMQFARREVGRRADKAACPACPTGLMHDTPIGTLRCNSCGYRCRTYDILRALSTHPEPSPDEHPAQSVGREGE